MKSRSLFPALMILILIALVMPNILNVVRGPAEKPGVFEANYTMSEASSLSKETGKPMLVLVTADWCPPCQTLKRSTLADPNVIDWIQSNTVPVYLEDGENSNEIRKLSVRSYPTTLLIQDGQVLASISGAVGSDKFVSSLGSVIETIPDSAP